MMKRVFISTFLLLIVGCSNKEHIPEKTFVSLYAHIFIIKTAATDTVMAATQVKALLDSHGVTKEQMQEQLKNYSNDPDTYRRVLQEIDDTLKTIAH